MAIQQLPSYVTVLFDNYSESITPALLRTDFDDGYTRQDSPVSRRAIVRTALLKLCSLQDLRDFKCWLRDSLNNGARWFEMYDIVEGRTLRARFVSGAFKFPPRAQLQSASAGLWTAECQIESWY